MSDEPTLPVEDSWHGQGLGVGARLGRYELTGLLGAGGMGIVLAARDPELDRQVAVKILRSTAGMLDSDGTARLRREGMAMARLTHPNVIRVYDVGIEGEHVFVAMELVRGTDLATWLRLKPRTDAEILAAFIEAGRGLAAAHDAGLVHRDFKPQNVLVGDDGRVLVTDFGLARDVDGRETDGPASSDSPRLASPAITETGAVVGTPAYMAPEQRRGAVDARA
ncbi:MAG: serine/threonine protein kinase, partial [Deltaproteobacteria bacterium]|nr:serine/threonine protein kinase [Kofleriaceae bacterium]